jgi:hypothetical protein
MPFFYFSQNNSGGTFMLTDNLTHHVFIEADTPDEANEVFRELGGYFNGCSDGRDCPCCGDRWYPTSEGEDTPLIYGEPLSSDPTTVGSWLPGGRNAVVHYADGRKVWF